MITVGFSSDPSEGKIGFTLPGNKTVWINGVAQGGNVQYATITGSTNTKIVSLSSSENTTGSASPYLMKPESGKEIFSTYESGGSYSMYLYTKDGANNGANKPSKVIYSYASVLYQDPQGKSNTVGGTWTFMSNDSDEDIDYNDSVITVTWTNTD